MAHDGPRHRGSHVHTPSGEHLPCARPWHCSGQVFFSQRGGAKPARHSHAHVCRAASQTHRPLPWHPPADVSHTSAHAERPQSAPAYPSAQRHLPVGASQNPCPRQPPGHALTTFSHASPAKPARQAHFP